MKILNILLLTILISTCCGTKSATTNEDANVIAKVETPEIPDPPVVEALPKVEEDTDTTVEINEPTIDPISTNTTEAIEIATSPDNYLAAFDHSRWNNLLQRHVSDQGNVNYKGFQADKNEFNTYLKSLTNKPPQESWNKDETLAYWMNVYNAFTVKLILDNYPTKSIKDIDGPWSQRFIEIGEKWYTLNDVEHKIIRKMDEPRIHFALVCAAVSCPRLYNKAFTAKTLEEDLSLLTRGFLNDNTKNELSENSIKLSKIFKWYGGDFKKNGSSLIDFLNTYTDVVIAPNAKKSYKDYNWTLNE